MAVYKIYCDESRQDSRNRYMLLGGLWIRKEEGWNFVRDFEAYCSRELTLSRPLGHIKWTKVPPGPDTQIFSAYEYLVDLYFQYNDSGKAFFRTLVVDKNSYDFHHPVFSAGDYEQGFYNLYCQLIVHWLEKEHEYHVRIAKREIKKAFFHDSESLRLRSLRDKINNRFARALAECEPLKDVPLPVRTVESRPAKQRRLIQLVDLLIGAVGFHWNAEHTKKDPREGKIFLAKKIASYLGKHDLAFATGKAEKRFNIFRFAPR